jgi:ubiquinone/menaquinone biosynthesis C-methylase UbiE
MNNQNPTGERLLPDKIETEYDYILYLQHLFAYDHLSKQLKNTDSVLEIGCGEGYGTRILSGKAGKVTGIDKDGRTILAAREKYRAANLVFDPYSGEKLPFPDSSFDRVAAFQVIEHVPDDSGFLKEAARVLKKGGIMTLTTPNRDYRLKPGQKPWYRFHVREYDRKGFEDVLKTAFNGVEVYSINASAGIYAIERSVARLASTLESWDFLNLRELASHGLRRRIINLWNAVACDRRKKGNPDFKNKYSLGDFGVSKVSFERSLDFLAVCVK